MQNGVIVALIPPPDVASALAIPGGEDASDLHITLANLGDVGSVNLQDARAQLQEWAARQPAISGAIGGVSKFNNPSTSPSTSSGGSSGQADDGQVAFCALFDAPSLPFLRESLLHHLEYCYLEAGVQLTYGFIPRITLSYIEPDAPLPLESIERTEVTFDRVSLLFGGERYDFDLLGQPYIYNGQQVKAVANEKGEWLLDVLGVPFGGPLGGKDLAGEFFDDRTDFWLEQIGKRAIVHYHGWDTKGYPTDPEIIGEELGYEKRADGIWFQVLLDKASETAKSIWEAALKGLARASSGAISHLVRPLKPADRKAQGGHIDLWPIAELSLMDTQKGNIPINSYAVALPVVKATFKAANLKLNLTESTDASGAETPGPERQPAQGSEATTKALTKEIQMSDPVTLEQLEAYLQKRDADTAEKARIAGLEAAKAELEALKAQIAAAQPATGTQQIQRLPNPAQEPEKPAAQVSVSSEWDGFSVGQLGLAYDMLKAKGRIPSARLYRALHAKATRLVDAPAFFEGHVIRNERGEILREFAPNVSAEAVKAVKAVNPMQMADNPAVKADELMHSTQSGFGDEWVPDLWTPELWDLVRNGAPVMKRFRQYEVPGESLSIPARGGRTTVYKVAESTEQADLNLASGVNAVMTKAASAKITLTPVKGMAWLGWSGELTETSIVPILPTLQSGLQEDLMEQIDEILISGDTDTANTNVSDTGNGAIAGTWHLLIANGLRDYALGNSNASDIGTLTAEDFLTIMGLLGTNGAFAIDPEKLFWLSDPGFYRTALSLGETLTAEKTGTVGTFQSGRLTKVYGSDLVISDRFGKTDANGKIHNTANNNTKGSCLLVRPDRWALGFGRRITIESPSRDLLQMVTDTQHLVAFFKLDFKNNGEGAAYGYNVTLVG